MSRTNQNKKAKPRPGAAKLAVELDKQIELKSDQLAQTLVDQFLKGNQTAMNIIARWAQDADFGQKCEAVHGRTLSQLLTEIENEQAEAAKNASGNSGEAPETATCSAEPENCSTASVAIAA